jgi:hypothetical protein
LKPDAPKAPPLDPEQPQTARPEPALVIPANASVPQVAQAEAAPPRNSPPSMPVTAGDAPQSLTGSVESWRKTLRLRYAPVDVEDANGGRVTLIAGPELNRLQDGQRVRVRGFIAPPTDRASAPEFHVQSVEVVE